MLGLFMASVYCYGAVKTNYPGENSPQAENCVGQPRDSPI